MKANANEKSERLQKHLKILQEAVRTFYHLEIGIEEKLKISLKLLLEDLRFDTVIVFLYDEPSHSLECAQAIVSGKGIIAGESRIPVTDNEEDLISAVFLGKRDSALWQDNLQLCLGLGVGDEKIGVLIADKLASKIPISEEEANFLNDYVDEFSRGILHIKVFQANFQKIDMLLALSKITEAMASTMDLKSVLSIILNSATEVLKFDRAKLYLINRENNFLEGEISADIRKVIKPITNEKYPIQPGVNRIVDVLLEKETGPSEGKYIVADLFLYMPLMMKQNKIGVLVLDNIFSHQPITKEDIENVRTVTNHATIAIENARLYAKVEELSIRDSLTGLYVRRYFLQRLEEEVARANRFAESFSLMIIDIDDFKKYNDLYGHPIGDKILRSLANFMTQKRRTTDIPGRYGGDEFIFILPKTSQDGVLIVAKRLQDLVKEYRLKFNNEEISFTLSIGVATYPLDGTTKDALIQKADEVLYWAKQHGKNQICSAKDLADK